MPSLFLVGGYRVFFWSNEVGEPVHVHVCKGAPTPDATKIWLTSRGGCILAHNHGRIPRSTLTELLEIIAAQHDLICSKWREFFATEEVHFFC